MPAQESFSHIVCHINGHTFGGWANEDPPYEFDFDESSDRQRGADGALYSKGMPVYGGTFTFKVFPTSQTAQWAMQQDQLRKDAHYMGTPERQYDGVLINNATSVSYRLEGGIIATLPAVAVPGVTYEGMIDFEKITSLVDSGTFTPRIAVAP